MLSSAELDGHSGGRLEGQNNERNANSRAHEVSETEGDSAAIHTTFCEESGCVLKNLSNTELKSKKTKLFGGGNVKTV